MAPAAECRSKDVLRCSHALTSKLFDDQADCSQVPAALKPSLCRSDCQSVLSVQSTMVGARSLAAGDVAASVLGMVRKIRRKIWLIKL